MRKLSKKTVAVAAGTMLFLSTAGVAYAYWTTTGGGTGTADTGTSTALVVNQTGTAIAGLTPGGPFMDLAGDFDNGSTGPVKISAVTASVTGVDVPHAGCLFADYKITGTTTAIAEIPAGDDKGAWSGLKINLENTGLNQDACKGATVTITYAVVQGS